MSFSRITSLYIFILITSSLSAASFYVGPDKTYASPNDLYNADVVQDGDSIFIDSGDYIGAHSLAVWTQHNLFIQGVGGRPHMIADGQAIWGKGIWVLAGDNITVDNIEFSGATVPDKNGAGIRLDGSGLTVTNCYFHNCENGILTNNTYTGVVTIEHSEFGGNGFSDGYSHNIYVGHIEKLIFRYNYTHHSKIGHTLKTRAAENIITYNRIMDEETGSSSRLVDIPNGGFTLMMGNLLMQGPNAENINAIGYGLEGFDNEDGNSFIFVNNTLVSKRGPNATFFHMADGTNEMKIFNNIFAGEGSMNIPSFAQQSHNILESTIDNLLFVDESNFGYQIFANSPAVDGGMGLDSIQGYSLTPMYQYDHPTGYIERNVSSEAIDIGAYEYEFITSLGDLPDELKIGLYPNPTHDFFSVKTTDSSISLIGLFNVDGQKVMDIPVAGQYQIRDLPKGIYFLAYIQGESKNLSSLLINKL